MSQCVPRAKSSTLQLHHILLGFKNRFSDLNKEQIGWDQFRKNSTNDHQEKALKEGCHEREWA